MGIFFILDCDQMGDFTLLCDTCICLGVQMCIHNLGLFIALVADSKLGTSLTLYVGQM